MKVLIACEYSDIVRSAFERAGHDAISCDKLPTEGSGYKHYQGDIFSVLMTIGSDIDLMIAHPPCTYLANSGVRWLHEQPGRWGKMEDAARFFKRLLDYDIPKIAVENPVMHGYAMEIIKQQPSQYIHPWQYGHGETKQTGLWLKGLPPLMSTNIVEGREARIHKMPPGPNRQKERSRFYTGIAEAMASQWGRR